MGSETIVIATAPITASSTAPTASQSPIWFTYGVDIALLILFLVVYFFVNPEEAETQEIIEEKQPNQLEKIPTTDPVEEKEKEDIVQG